jgi:hypothetical protein
MHERDVKEGMVEKGTVNKMMVEGRCMISGWWRKE